MSESSELLSSQPGHKKVTRVMWRFFYLFCFFAGQYINFRKTGKQDKVKQEQCFSAAGLILFVCQMIVYVVCLFTTVTIEGWTIANSSFVENTSSADSIDCMLPKEHWKFTTAITIGTISAFISYVLITFVILIPINGSQRRSDTSGTSDGSQRRSNTSGTNDGNSTEGYCITCKKVYRDSTLSPYDNNDESSKLSTTEKICFFTNYLVVLILFIAAFISSVVYANIVYKRDYCWINALYLAMMVLHLSSHFCAIHSCFLFSKIVYQVTNKLNKLCEEMNRAISELQYAPEPASPSEEVQHTPPVSPSESRPNSGNRTSESDREDLACIKQLLVNEKHNKKVDRECYHRLQEIDQDFMKEVKPTLKLIGYWFIFHWAMFALTTVLNTAFIVQIIIDVIQYNVQSANSLLPNIEADVKVPYLFYVISFTLFHAYLFLYPCFRAAAIATNQINQWNVFHDSLK